MVVKGSYMKHLFLLSLLMLAAPAAYANVGIPIVVVGVPFMLAHLLAVVLIETIVLKCLRKDLNTWQMLKQITLANLITTLIGYPIVGILEGLFPLIGLNIGWLLPFNNIEKMHGYISIMMLISLVPCYFLSVYVEGQWLRKRLSNNISKKDIYLIHTASYLYLVLLSYLYNPLLLLSQLARLLTYLKDLIS